MDLFEYAQRSDAAEEKAAQPAVFTVSEITTDIKTLIASRFGRENFWVKGELSNFKGRNQSGHMYFRLKDAGAVLNCVFFNNANRKLKIELKEGMDVLAFGRVDVWEKGGNYQLVVEEMRVGGTGELYLRFEQLKKKLEEEGLFAQARKKPIPPFPQKIGLVTSATGAVIRDIIHVVRNRCPFVKLVLYSVKVQGDGAKEEIAAAIEELNKPAHGLDLLIVGRGGGSIEDLWAFNEELVARAIAASRLPVISAVGHQTDFTIADFVADHRAATPSQAAEMAVPDVSELRRRVDLLMRQIVQELLHLRDVLFQRFDAVRRSPALRDPRSVIRSRAQEVDLAVERLSAHIRRGRDRDHARVSAAHARLKLICEGALRPYRTEFEKIASNLSLLNPLAILERGYSVVRKTGGKIVKSAGQVAKGENVSVRLHEGELACQITKISGI